MNIAGSGSLPGGDYNEAIHISGCTSQARERSRAISPAAVI